MWWRYGRDLAAGVVLDRYGIEMNCMRCGTNWDCWWGFGEIWDGEELLQETCKRLGLLV